MIRPVLLASLVLALPATALAQKKPAGAPHRNALDAEFTASDTNKDGVLTRAEIDARTARMHVAGGKVSPADMKRLGDIWFARADANRDGKITKAEMNAMMTAVATRYDTNHDGTISLAERKAARAAAMAEVKAGR